MAAAFVASRGMALLGLGPYPTFEPAQPKGNDELSEA